MLRSTLEHPFAANTCFLCAEPLHADNWSEEHVVPRWVQKQFEISDSRLTLLNRTEIPYRQLKIPCCKPCNNEELARREKQVQDAILQGFDATRALPRILLMQWVGKIFLGMLYKELHLPFERKTPQGERIIPVEVIKEYSFLFFWLQKALRSEEPNHFCPASIFLFRTKEAPVPKFGFDMLDNVTFKTFAIRLGKVGIIADFLENGVHYKNFAEKYRRYRALELNPEQFRELAAKIFYTASLIRLKTAVRFFQGAETTEFLTYWEPDGEHAFGEWDMATYARILAHYWNMDIKSIFVPPDGVWTLLHNADGTLLDLPFETPRHAD